MPAKILVVDDSRTQRSAIAAALEQAGYEVVQGENGLKAVQLVQSQGPDLIVSDITMPEMTGYQLCRLIKSDPTTEHLPIILLTTLEHRKHRFWGREAGADSYVNKSQDLALLQKEIERLLAARTRPAYIRRRESDAGATPAAQTRLSDLLDRLLFEATVTNRIRAIARHGGDLTKSADGFFDFFQDLVDYDVAYLCVRADKRARLWSHFRGPISADVVERAKAEICDYLRLGATEDESIEEISLNSDGIVIDEVGKTAASLAHRWITFTDSSIGGGLAVFSLSSRFYNDETERTLRIVARELEPTLKSNLQAEAMERLKADFTAMIIHDLRSPLTNVMSAAAMMEDGALGPVTDEQKKWLNRIETVSQQLVNLVSDFLDVSKLEAGRLEVVPEEVDLQLLLQDCAEAYGVRAQGKKIVIKKNVAADIAKIKADPRRLDQVLENFLSNALKFTPAGGEIEIGAGQTDHATVKLWVKDTGIGIPAKEIDKLFEKYRQSASGKSAKDKGTGLGLVICKMIVEAHGGKIWAESEEGKGTIFLFNLPIAGPTT
jgi:signal transduction histidine kinase/CheY-like chemotaxis protein